VHCILAEVLGQVIRHVRERESVAGAHRGRLIYERSCSFIANNLGRHIAPKDLALQAGVSFRHLARLFAQYAGESPHHYVVRKQLDLACEKLREEPARAIKEVSYECGFSSPSQFTMAFKKRFGMAPTSFVGKVISHGIRHKNKNLPLSPAKSRF
jgi:AraC family transcriptional regulator